MDFTRARTPQQIIIRQEEIIDACEKLFDQYGYDGVNFKAISTMTSITRSSIYNYYKTKEEILLDLLRREIVHFQSCLIDMMNPLPTMTKEQYSFCLTQTLSVHSKMLLLASMMHTILENNCDIEKLADFEKEIVRLRKTMLETIDRYFPKASAGNKAIFVTAFLAYILGLYSLSSQRQLEAIHRAGVISIAPDFQHLCYRGILLLLSDL
ncbi:MAG TPA: TetR family transcriptional regulator [Syntrophales bacterium]|nr:TetR family transcriptional regulator [Syntrophales bacterium]